MNYNGVRVTGYEKLMAVKGEFYRREMARVEAEKLLRVFKPHRMSRKEFKRGTLKSGTNLPSVDINPIIFDPFLRIREHLRTIIKAMRSDQPFSMGS